MGKTLPPARKNSIAMSSLYAIVQAAEEFLQSENDEAARNACAFAQDIISQHWPKDEECPPAICCFSVEGDMLWCHDRNRQPLYFAPITKRPALCKACREDCRKRLAALVTILSRRKKKFA